MIYTGVGSHHGTPSHILDLCADIATWLAQRGHKLYSGGAKQCDSAFEYGTDRVSGAKRIFLASECTDAAWELAASVHPCPSRALRYKNLIGRDVFQVLGISLGKIESEISSGVICWTPDGCIHHSTRTYNTGGTGTAISIASLRGISVWNLAIQKHRELWTAKISE